MSDSGSIEAVLEHYFDAIHRGDVDLLRTVFHPEAHLHYAPQGRYANLSLDEWLRAVSSRPSPASAGEPRSGQVLLTDHNGPHTAFAKVTLRVGAQRGTDYLSLLHVDGAWRIVSKTFHVTRDP